MIAENVIHEGPEFLVYKEMRRDVPAPVAIKQIKNKEAPARLKMAAREQAKLARHKRCRSARS